MKTIFVSIGCYEDDDVIKTVQDLYQQAAWPGRIRVVVILQTDNYSRFKGRLAPAEVYLYPTSWSAGCGKARRAAMRRHVNEDYFFQTDSHMRFEPGWDQALIDELEACPSDRPILTTLPLNFVIATGERPPQKYSELRIIDFYRHLPLVTGYNIPLSEYVRPEEPQPVPVLAGGVLFSHGKLCDELSYDPYMFFHGEEHSTNMRLWTMGYDNFTPRVPFCYHAYRSLQAPGHKTIDSYMPEAETRKLHERSVTRAQVLTGVLPAEAANPECLLELDKYGLGTKRAIAEWEAKFGVSLKDQTFRRRGSS